MLFLELDIQDFEHQNLIFSVNDDQPKPIKDAEKNTHVSSKPHANQYLCDQFLTKNEKRQMIK